MEYYDSLISEFCEAIGPVATKTSSGKLIYAKKFTAHAADLHRDKMLIFAVAVKNSSPDLDGVGAGIKWFVLKNSLCDDKGKLISNQLLENLKNANSPDAKSFIDECYDHCQRVNEVGKYTPKQKDENGEPVIDEETGVPKT